MKHTSLPRTVRFLAVSALLVLAACGATEAGPGSQPPTDGPDTITIIHDGGCQMAGPNCPTYEIDRDGTLRLYRTGDPAVVTEASVDAAVVAELWDQITQADIPALIDRAGPGTCQGCVDGIDTVVTYTLEGAEVRLDSTVVAFDPDEPFFVILNEAVEAAAGAVELPLQQR